MLSVFNTSWTLETTLTSESNDLTPKLGLPPHPASSFITNLVFLDDNNLIHEFAITLVRNSNNFFLYFNKLATVFCFNVL